MDIFFNNSWAWGVILFNGLLAFHIAILIGSGLLIWRRWRLKAGDVQLSTKMTNDSQNDSLKLPFKNAKVHRIDLAENFILKCPVREYMSLMGEATYFTKGRPHSKNGLYYTNARRWILFYDKVKDYQDKKLAHLIPDVYKDRNVLRYELRFTKRLKQQFSSEVKAADLYNEDFYINMIDRWLTTYFDIKKIKTFTDEDF